jgi:hypothetical protein
LLSEHSAHKSKSNVFVFKIKALNIKYQFDICSNKRTLFFTPSLPTFTLKLKQNYGGRGQEEPNDMALTLQSGDEGGLGVWFK